MKFNKEQFAAVFKAHYDLLVRFHEGTKHAGIVMRICKKLLKYARYVVLALKFDSHWLTVPY